jgi:hypothetical protein
MIIITVAASIWLSGRGPGPQRGDRLNVTLPALGVGNVHGMSVHEPLLVRVHPVVAVT